MSWMKHEAPNGTATIIQGGAIRSVRHAQRDSNSIGDFGGFAAAKPTAPETTVPHDRGMRHAPNHQSRASATTRFVPTYRQVKPLRDADDPAPPEGKRYLPAPRLPELPRPERMHTSRFNRRTVEEREFVAHMGNKIRVNQAAPSEDAGLSVGRRQAKEVDVAGMMQRKARVGSTARARNGLPAAYPGDKLYGAVEYSDDFFAGGGLVPGANIGTRGPKAMTNVHLLMTKEYKDRELAERALKANHPAQSCLSYEKMSFEAKRRQRDLYDDIRGVVALTEDGVFRGEDTSWEGHTGLSLTTKGKVWSLDNHAKLEARLAKLNGAMDDGGAAVGCEGGDDAAAAEAGGAE